MATNPDRDPVEVEAGALIRYRLVGYDRGMEPSMDGAYVTYADAVALARTEATRAGEAMREAAARWHENEAAEIRAALAAGASDLGYGRALHDEHKVSAAAIGALPVSDAPAPPWRSMDSAPKDGTEFVAWQDGDVYRCQWRSEDDGEGRLDEGWWDFVNSSFEEPTLWTDLPTPPAKDD